MEALSRNSGLSRLEVGITYIHSLDDGDAQQKTSNERGSRQKDERGVIVSERMNVYIGYVVPRGYCIILKHAWRTAQIYYSKYAPYCI
jgi:hypothetical protein